MDIKQSNERLEKPLAFMGPNCAIVLPYDVEQALRLSGPQFLIYKMK